MPQWPILSANRKVTSEPVVRESSSSDNDAGLICNLAVRGVWNPQTVTLFDFRIVNTCSVLLKSVSAFSSELAASVENTKHQQACAGHHADLTPFVCSMDGAFHCEAHHFLHHLAARLADKWERPNSQMVNQVHARMAIRRATTHCECGSCRKFFCLCLKNGAAMARLL